MNRLCWSITVWVWTVCLTAQTSVGVSAPQPGLPAGTVLISRNSAESDNTAPGYWNHLAICAGSVVIESRQEVGVVATPLNVYLIRPYSRILVLRPSSLVRGQTAAQRALALLGTPYAPLSSLVHGVGGNGPLRLKLGLNCVSVVEECYRLPRLNIPDNVLGYTYPCDCTPCSCRVGCTFCPPEVLR